VLEGVILLGNSYIKDLLFVLYDSPVNILIVNTSGKAGAQIPHPPLGDYSSPWGR
jgi:hypothetical protein